MQDKKNEEYVTCPRCEKEVYKDVVRFVTLVLWHGLKVRLMRMESP